MHANLPVNVGIESSHCAQQQNGDQGRSMAVHAGVCLGGGQGALRGVWAHAERRPH